MRTRSASAGTAIREPQPWERDRSSAWAPAAEPSGDMGKTQSDCARSHGLGCRATRALGLWAQPTATASRQGTSTRAETPRRARARRGDERSRLAVMHFLLLDASVAG